jgi:hypothetical protein
VDLQDLAARAKDKDRNQGLRLVHINHRRGPQLFSNLVGCKLAPEGNRLSVSGLASSRRMNYLVNVARIATLVPFRSGTMRPIFKTKRPIFK